MLTERDPRTDPREGDVLRESDGSILLHVDHVDAEQVYWRVIAPDGGCLSASRMPLAGHDRIHSQQPANP